MIRNKQERKAQIERLEKVKEATADERNRFNTAIQSKGGPVVILTTFAGRYQVDAVTSDWWYISHPEGTAESSMNQRSWCGCNDGTWDDLMKQAGVSRNPLFHVEQWPATREAAIHADVFRPDETDLQYAQRRARELGISAPAGDSGSVKPETGSR